MFPYLENKVEQDLFTSGTSWLIVGRSHASVPVLEISSSQENGFASYVMCTLYYQ